MPNKSFTISIIILLATITGVFLISRRGEPVVIATKLEDIPMEIVGFKAREDFFSESVYKELNADKHVYRHYRSDDGRQVDLYIGYYGTAKGGRTPHNPYACLPGAGWGIVESNKIKLEADYYQNGVEVNYILSQKGRNFDVVLHWYQSDRDKILATGIQQNIQRFLGRIFHNRNDGAFVRVTVTTDKKHIEESKNLVKLFAQKVLSLLPDYWPLEK